MKAKLLVGLFLMIAQTPKNDPSGVWEAETGSKYSMKLTGNDVKVTIVPNSNPRSGEMTFELTRQHQDRPE